jgi:hypothetical protein
MKMNLLMLTFALLGIGSQAQDSMEKTMENRARELHRVLGLTSSDDYKKFMRENYTQVLIDKPVKMSKQVSDSDGGNENSKSEGLDNLTAKAQMYTQLHQDFGGSKLVSLKRTDNKIAMVLKNSEGLTGTFNLTFEKSMPYLIEAIGIQVEMEN